MMSAGTNGPLPYKSTSASGNTLDKINKCGKETRSPEKTYFLEVYSVQGEPKRVLFLGTEGESISRAFSLVKNM